MKDHKASTLPNPHQPVAGSQTFQLYQKGQITNIKPTKTIPINLPMFSRTPPSSTKFQSIKHGLQPSTLPKAALSRKLNIYNLLAVSDRSRSNVVQTPKEETADA
ncbi:hypothetical protein ACTXT7_000310 [Hymenolepis weldensis]